MNFIDELKRRKVGRVIVAYGVVAFVLLQLGEIIFPGLNLPDWTLTFLIVILGMGFPVAVVLAWIFDKTPKGIIRTDNIDENTINSSSDDSRTFFQRKRTWFAVAGVLLGVLIGIYGSGIFSYQPSLMSIAVLPFDNYSTAPEDQFFSDGITEVIIANLAKVEDLKVISRTSVMEYKGTTKKLKNIAEELGVAHILEGSVQRANGRVRIIGQLIDTRTDEHLWAETYDRNEIDIFDIQSDVAIQIAQAMQAELTESATELIKDRPTDNLAAYELYMKGRNYQNRSFRESDFKLAIDFYDQAIQLDPKFAVAYAALSETHDFVIWMGYDISDQRKALVSNNLKKAKQLDPDHSEVRLANAIHLYRQRNYYPAMDEYRAVRELQPGNSEIWERIAYVQYRVGQFQASLNNLLDAYAVNPKSPRLVLQVGMGHQLMFDYENAIRYYDISINLAPDISSGAYNWKSQAMLLNGYEEPSALEVLDQGIERTSDESLISARILHAFHSGNFMQAQNLLGMLKEPFGGFGYANNTITPKELISGLVLRGLGNEVLSNKNLDIARVKMESKVQQSPGDYRTHSGLGIVYAYLGMREEAIREGKMALAILPVSKDSFFGAQNLFSVAYTYMVLGDYNSALNLLETVINQHGGITIEHIQNLPEWKPLRDHPRVQQWIKDNKQTS